MMENLRESLRWIKQAEKDLSSAKNSLSAGDYEWACFQSQQSAEKALKSFLYWKGYRKILTHSIFELIKETGIGTPKLQEYIQSLKFKKLVQVRIGYDRKRKRRVKKILEYESRKKTNRRRS